MFGGYLWECLFASDFLESCNHCDVARQPEETEGSHCTLPRNSPAHDPPKTTDCLFLSLVFVRIKQMRHNVIISKL